jgi:hypothetical protein
MSSLLQLPREFWVTQVLFLGVGISFMALGVWIFLATLHEFRDNVRCGGPTSREFFDTMCGLAAGVGCTFLSIGLGFQFSIRLFWRVIFEN